jgi:hypothetical protein
MSTGFGPLGNDYVCANFESFADVRERLALAN